MTQLVPAQESSAPKLPGGDSLEAGVRIGDFRIERRLGAGGMGIVYLARQVSLDRPVALKVLGQALTQRADVARFQREAQAAARLKHPSIAQVYYIGQDRHVCYLAMELVDGISLRRVLDRLGNATAAATSLDTAVLEELTEHPVAPAVRFDVPTDDSDAGNNATVALPALGGTGSLNPYLSPQARELRTSPAHVRRVCEVVRDAARALAHAHGQGVVHRDIKPDNLLLDRSGQVHVIDFGVARFFDDQSVTCTGQLVGTPLYMSPEQVTGRGAIDARSDIYSLGLVLYELLALRPPVEAINRENVLRTIVTKALPPVSWRNRAVSVDLERVVHKATHKDPDQRYQSAADFAADLDQSLAGKPVTAPLYSYRLDEREITAARPSQAVSAAVVYFMLAFFLFTAIESLALFLGIILGGQGGAIVIGAYSAIALVILIGGQAIGTGILGARAWARWIGVTVAGALTLASLVGVVAMIVGMVGLFTNDLSALGLEPDEPPTAVAGQPPFSTRNMFLGMLAMYLLPVVMGLALGSSALWCLLCRTTGRWFRFARELRLEHRAAKEHLAGL
jgi:serine/threonine protein kinase